MIELGMEVEDMNGYVGVVAGSPRNGNCPAFQKWLEKRELAKPHPPKGGFFFALSRALGTNPAAGSMPSGQSFFYLSLIL